MSLAVTDRNGVGSIAIAAAAIVNRVTGPAISELIPIAAGSDLILGM